MDIDITLNNEKLTGTIKNNFPFALKDVTLISGIKEIKLGDIEANGTLKVDTELKATVLQNHLILLVTILIIIQRRRKT